MQFSLESSRFRFKYIKIYRYIFQYIINKYKQPKQVVFNRIQVVFIYIFYLDFNVSLTLYTLTLFAHSLPLSLSLFPPLPPPSICTQFCNKNSICSLHILHSSYTSLVLIFDSLSIRTHYALYLQAEGQQTNKQEEGEKGERECAKETTDGRPQITQHFSHFNKPQKALGRNATRGEKVLYPFVGRGNVGVVCTY